MQAGVLEVEALVVVLAPDKRDGAPTTAEGKEGTSLGKVKVEGDMTKLMAMQSGAVDPAALEAAKEIQAITE